MPYEAAVQGWHDFYIVTGSAAATLMGLLFVGLSLHLRAVLTRPEMRSLARATFTNFTVVLLVALFILIPQSAGGLSQELIFSGIVSVAILTPSLLRATRSPTLTLRVSQLAIRRGVSILGYAAVVSAGALFSAGTYETGLTMLAVVAVVLLVISLRNSWDLLVSVGDATLGGSEGAAVGTDAEAET